MIVSENKKCSDSKETWIGLLLAVIFIIFICVGVSLAFWLRDIYQNGLLCSFTVAVFLIMPFGIAWRICKAVGIDFFYSMFGSEYTDKPRY